MWKSSSCWLGVTSSRGRPTRLAARCCDVGGREVVCGGGGGVRRGEDTLCLSGWKCVRGQRSSSRGIGSSTVDLSLRSNTIFIPSLESNHKPKTAFHDFLIINVISLRSTGWNVKEATGGPRSVRWAGPGCVQCRCNVKTEKVFRQFIFPD